MSFSKLSLLAAAATLTFGGLSAHADSLTVGNFYSGNVKGNSNAGDITYTFNGSRQIDSAGAGNFTGTTAIINGKPVAFSAVYCVILFDTLQLGRTTHARFTAHVCV